MTGGAGEHDDEARAARAAFRAYVRANHPDVGGDPDEFAEWLATSRAARDAARNAAEPEEDDSRYDAPISFVTSPKFTARWRRRKKRPPRVD
ncbi:hypothetical protein [Amycolatopsis sp. CA-230715]|uniref:hypothetical protein n=1 Tax=Amycolatopsis sp. CA-230715 TaxID=2745196 RepID=UPI001C03802E|nr:hypothetical protein [Amycolatopsis sp. CA-230715]QWF76849.1 hypothetical protein HUW46_00229 [Amycolatopsis sp. CA-230715]